LVPASGPDLRLSIPIVMMASDHPSSGHPARSTVNSTIDKDIFTFYRQNFPDANLLNLKAALDLAASYGINLSEKALGIELLMSWSCSANAVAAFVLLDFPEADLTKAEIDPGIIELINRSALARQFSFDPDFGGNQGGLFMKMLTSRERNIEVLLINAADLFSQLSANIGDKIHPLARVAVFAYARFLKVLHFDYSAQQLEDLGFLKSDPEKYIETATSTFSGIYQKGPKYFIGEMRTIVELLAEQLPDYHFSWRLKGVWSTANKPRAVHDILGVSCETDSEEACRSAMTAITDNMSGMGYKLKKYEDYIFAPRGKDPKNINEPNDKYYQALHLTFMSDLGWEIEIQIKSREMAQKAAVGECSHIRYKLSGSGFDEDFIIEAPNARAVYEATHLALGSKGMAYVIDEQERLVDVGPKYGADPVTVLDYAFRLGLEPGCQATGAVIQRQTPDGSWKTERVGFDYPIKSGDKIALTCAHEAQPLTKARRRAARTHLAIASIELIAAGVTSGRSASFNKLVSAGEELFTDLSREWEEKAFSLFKEICRRDCGGIPRLLFSFPRIYGLAGFRDSSLFHAALGISAKTSTVLLTRVKETLANSSIVTAVFGDSIYIMFNNTNQGALARLLEYFEGSKLDLKELSLAEGEGYCLARFKVAAERSAMEDFCGRLSELYKHSYAAEPLPIRQSKIEVGFNLDRSLFVAALSALNRLSARVIEFEASPKTFDRDVRARIILPAISVLKFEDLIDKRLFGKAKKVKVTIAKD